MKFDDKEEFQHPPFKPESPFVIVCEGFQDGGFFCALLKHLNITNCDVTFPKKKRDGANGKEGIPAMVRLLSEVPTVQGIAVMRDADEDANASFTEAQAAFVAPFPVPTHSFVVERERDKATGVFLIPGNGQLGALETLLLKAVFASHAEFAICMNSLEGCHQVTANWTENKKAKMRMQCVIASFCQENPGCSLGFIWGKGKDNPIDIASTVFQELADFLHDFTSVPAAPAERPDLPI